MTPDQIRQIAKEYAEAMCPAGDYCGGVYDEQRNCDLPIYRDDAKSVLEFLAERYCVVERSKVVEMCELAVNNASSDDFGLIDGLTDLVCDMFNEEYHNVIDNSSETFNKKEDE